VDWSGGGGGGGGGGGVTNTPRRTAAQEAVRAGKRGLSQTQTFGSMPTLTKAFGSMPMLPSGNPVGRLDDSDDDSD
jgi:hypothetical protein